MNRVFRDRVASVLMAITILPGAGAFAPATDAPSPSAPSFEAPAPDAPAPAVPGGKPAVARVSDADRLTPSELEELLGPIALYPDPLLANVLAACVYPEEVAEAAKFMVRGGKPEQVDAKPWEDSVKAVAKIPDAIKMMGQYREWVVAVGQAYLIQAKDVMDVCQSLRKKAQDNGALKTTVEQKVIVEKEVVYIQPADPEIIYVPTYNPQVVYVDNYNHDAAVAGVVGFGVGIAAGLIIANNMDCHWGGGYVGWGHYGGHYGGDYHGGNYRSNNDLTINGDVNIGNRNDRVNSNDVRNRSGNRVGNEGNAWSPNKSKNLASSDFNQMKQFKGGATAANRSRVPGGGNRGSGASAGNTAGRAPGAGGAGKPAARPGQSANRPAQPAARPSAKPARSPSAGSSSRVPKTPPRQSPSSSGSAFRGSSGSSTRAESQRGAASRSRSSGGSVSRGNSGGASRSRSSGASRGGGGARGGGGRGGGRR